MEKSHKIFFVLIVLFSLIVMYTIWDNQRIKIVTQEIIIEDLPSSLKGFTILQITDLHEKEFGKGQRDLIELINSIQYDSILFTGDMLNDSNSKNFAPYYRLIEDINNKENAIYIPGNTDPESYSYNRDGELTMNQFVKGMEKRGVELLDTDYSIKNEEATVHFIEFELSTLGVGTNLREVNGVVLQNYQKDVRFDKIQSKLLQEIEPIKSQSDHDIYIGLSHYPIVDRRIEYLKKDPNFKYNNFDLIIAGHYHGGQIRIPFIGAAFVPEPWYDNNGLFPPKNRVKGLWEYKGTKQYVSAGLGSSDAIPLINFRLFNTPEVNVLILTSGD